MSPASSNMSSSKGPGPGLSGQQVFPTWGIVAVEGHWGCECGSSSCKAGKYPHANWAIHCNNIHVIDLGRKPV